MQKSNLRATAALQALALLGAGVPLAFIAAAPAAAQDYTSGVITGTVTNAAGVPVAGAAVAARSEAQGFTRATTTGADGRFTFASLPAGEYDVIVQAAGTTTFRADNVLVVAGRTSDLPIALTAAAADAATGSEIVVVGRRIQAFTGTTTGLNVDVEEVKNTVPVSRNLTSLVLLAPGTSRGDTAFGNLASIGGASVAENAYYVNGLNITNFDNYLGSAEVPFDFYKSVEVKSGGYPAEFGRATGGIVNAVTKAGTNDWLGEAHVSWSPNFLRSDAKDLVQCQDVDRSDRDPTTQVIECENLTNRSEDYSKRLESTLELGGPIIRDRLFVYGLLQLNDIKSQTVNRISGTAFRYRNNDPFWGVKIDAFPINNHQFELTVFDTRNTTERSDLTYSEDDSGNGVFGLANSVTAFNGGGLNYVGKYTGTLTDFLTVSGAYGRMRDRFDVVGVAGAAGLPYVRNLSGGTVGGVRSGGFFNAQRIATTSFPYNTERKFYRADADVRVSFFGDHHFRAGFDVEKNTLEESAVRTGAATLLAGGNISQAAFDAGGGGAGVAYLVRPGGQVELNYFNSGGAFEAQNDAIYLQDEWNVTDRLTVNAGIRRDNFEVKTAAGESFAKLKNNWAPRIGLTYDVFPDRRGRIKAFYGQYYLPFASNTAFRMTGSEFFFRERFFYTGFDANGVPILGAQVTDNAAYQQNCPFPLTPQSSGQFCNVTGEGDVADARSLVAQNLKATKQAEYILGYDHKFGRIRTGINFIHRKLLATAEDSAIDAAVISYCQREGITIGGAPCSDVFGGFHQYVIMNPGSDLEVYVPEFDKVITLTADELGYPKAKRTYTAVELMFDRPYDGVWTLGGSYTWSKSKGNSEGFVQSDFGQDDAGITQDFDQPGFSDNAYGYLPTDRRHRFKLYGAYTFWDRLTLGANTVLESPRPLSCFGFHPTDVFAQAYGAASRYCGGQPVQRGKGLKSSWLFNTDVKVAYKMNIPTGQTIQLRADIFNIFNKQGVRERDEVGDLDAIYNDAGTAIVDYVPNPNYGLATSYQAPRSVRLGLDVWFGGPAALPPPPLAVVAPPPPPAAPATQTCPDGSVILATAMCPAPPPPPPPPPPPGERG